MRTITAATPDGTAWTVRVVWQARWKALARRFGGWRRKRRDALRPLDGLDVPTGGGEEWFATEVVGWREALRTRDEIADKIRLGYPAPVVGSLQQR